MSVSENFSLLSVFVKVVILMISTDIISAGSTQLVPDYQPNYNYYGSQTEYPAVEGINKSSLYNGANHQKFDYSPSNSEESWNTNSVEIEHSNSGETAEVLQQSITGTKIIKIGSAVVVGALFLATVLLGVIARNGARIAPIAFPLAVLPIGLLAAIPAIPLFIGTFGKLALKDKLGLHKRRNKRSATGITDVEEIELLEKTIQILSFLSSSDYGTN